MSYSETVQLIEKLLEAIEKLIPDYIANPDDRGIANGNVAVCIIDEKGQLHGKMWGDNKIRVRESYHVAWRKASQVWITGMKTGEYEKEVFSGRVNEWQFGINRPDFIGWIGGQPVTLENGDRFSIGFSGFRGESDLEIVQRAFANLSIKLKIQI